MIHLGPPLLCCPNSYRIGMAKAAVLPDPVGATAITFRFCNITGMAYI